jgi:hypothetical protein
MDLTLKGFKYKLIIYLVLLILIYYLTQSSIFPIANHTFSEKSRGIETFPKFIFNGILGQFFNFKWIGNIIFLLPILFFNQLKKLSKANLLFFLTLFLSFTIIAIKGYFGWRYMFTLLPLFLIFFSSEIANFSVIQKIKGDKYIQIFIVILALSILNCYVLNAFGNDWFIKRYFVFTILFFSVISIYAIANTANTLLVISGIIIAECLFFRYDFNTNQHYWLSIVLLLSYTFFTIELSRNSNVIVAKISNYIGVMLSNLVVKGTCFLLGLILFYVFYKKSFLALTTDYAIIVVLVMAVYHKFLKPNYTKAILLPVIAYYVCFNFNTSQIGNSDAGSNGLAGSFKIYFNALNAPFSNNSNSKTVLNYINSHIPQNETILLNHLPSFYYYSNNKYLYYWCQEDHAFNEMGQVEIFGKRALKDVYADLKGKYQVKYILTSKYKNQFCQVPFDEFLNDYCTEVFNQYDYLLYKLK